MTLISLVKASKNFGIKSLFNDLDLYIQKKEKLGLIGPNGSGKSTLLKVIAGIEPILEGERKCSPFLKIKIVSQDMGTSKTHSILEEVIEGCGEKKSLLLNFNQISNAIAKAPGDKELMKKLGEVSELMDIAQAWDLEQQCKEILMRLGIVNLEKKINELSGGYRKRVNLASALVSNPDVLMLDEPTNHLDAYAIEWLQSWLNKFKGVLILVTHDRYFLDQVTNRLIEINQGVVKKYKGNYSIYLQQKIEEEEYELQRESKFKGILRKELSWLKQGPKARSSKQKARIKRIKEMQEIPRRKEKKTLEMESNARRIGKVVIEAEDILLKIDKEDKEKIIVDNFNYSFSKEDRVGIIGRNGSGKSSILDIISGKKNPTSGTITIGETIHIGYLDQHTDELIKGKGLNRKVIEYIEEVANLIEIGKKKITASQLLEKFLFPPAQQHSKISKLSGGEKRRLTLCRILIQSPNVLLLDEPTNDLDIKTLSILEDYIEDFKGCVIVVSHDRYFLDRTVDRIFNLEDGKIERFEGNYSEFLSKISAEKEVKSNNFKRSLERYKGDLNQNIKEGKEFNKSKKISFKDLKEIERIEKELPELEKKKKTLNLDITKGNINIVELSNEMASIIIKIEELEERWLEIKDK